MLSEKVIILLVRFVRKPLAPEEGRCLAVLFFIQEESFTMKTTFMANAGNITRKWYIVDAEGLTVGRLAANVAKVLSGKNKPTHRMLIPVTMSSSSMQTKSF